MNIGSFLTQSSLHNPNSLAVAYGQKCYSYSEFNSRVNRLANAFNRLGVKKGDNIALLQFNCPEMLESMFACFKSGIGSIPINFRLHPNEYEFIIKQSEAKAVIFSNEYYSELSSIMKNISNVRHFITTSELRDEILNYEKLIIEESDEWKDVDVDPDDLAWLFYTSGTTGKPKGAMLTHRNLLVMTLSYYADYGQLTTNDSILHAAPLSHGSGLYALPNIAKGAANIILKSKSFNPRMVFEAIEKNRVSTIFASPTMVKMMIESYDMQKYDLTSLRSIIYGGGPMHLADLKVAINKLGNRLTQLYGMGESPMTISYLPQSEHIVNNYDQENNKLRSAGINRTGVEIKIFDQNDNEVPSMTIGQVVTRSDVVMKGYWQNKKATAETLRGGWLHTGDIGYLDSNGYLFLMDRSKDMIISGGENIYPREIEEVILTHPAVREVAVIGIPDLKWGEAVKAFICLVPGKSVTKNEIIELCKANLASYKKPKAIDIIDEIPKNNFGKIIKRKLKENYWKESRRLI